MNDITQRPRRRRGFWGDDLDDLLEGFLRTPGSNIVEGGKSMLPAVDVVEHDNEYVVRANLPGVRREDIDVSIQDNVLTINAESKSETEEKKAGRVIRQERHYGKFVRSMSLGAQVDESRVKASYNNGVLELILPKAEEVKPKKISVNVS